MMKKNFGPKGRPFYLIYIDFGMTGTLTPQIIDGLVSTLIAVVSRDAAQA
jgi:predicted unusual protein kinase regulating ubiquinone biosynthesis (AarF/ABC1/UbiB family)